MMTFTSRIVAVVLNSCVSDVSSMNLRGIGAVVVIFVVGNCNHMGVHSVWYDWRPCSVSAHVFLSQLISAFFL